MFNFTGIFSDNKVYSQIADKHIVSYLNINNKLN